MAAITTHDSTKVLASDPWLFGRWLDLLVGCGLGYIVLIPVLLGYGYATSDQSWPFTALMVFAILINAPHYGATVLRVYETREGRSKYRFFAVHATLALVLLLAVGSRSVWLASVLFTIYVTWSPWHFAGQNYGLALMFLRRRGVEVDARTKRLFYLSFALSAALAILAIHGRNAHLALSQPTVIGFGVPKLLRLPIPPSLLLGLFVGVGAAYAGCLASVAWRLRVAGAAAQAPAWILVSTQALWYTVPALATGNALLPFAVAWVSAAHSLQYLWITAYYAKHSPARAQPGQFFWKSLIAGTAVSNLPTLFFAPDLLGFFPWDAGLAMVTFSIVNIHHFILDGAIWKLRDGGIARVLLRASPPLAPDAAARPRSSRFGALVWGVASLSLLVPILAAYEEVRFSRDPTPERAAQAMQHLRWVGRESVQKHVLVARMGEKKGRDEFAIAQYRRSIELFPSADAWDGLGAVYMRQGRFELALDAYEHAIALKPDSPRLWYRRARLELALAKGGTSPEPDMLPTISALRRVLELQPGHEPASLLLARLVATAGRRDEAVKILESAIEHAGDAPSSKLRQRLAELQQAGS